MLLEAADPNSILLELLPPYDGEFAVRTTSDTSGNESNSTMAGSCGVNSGGGVANVGTNVSKNAGIRCRPGPRKNFSRDLTSSARIAASRSIIATEDELTASPYARRRCNSDKK